MVNLFVQRERNISNTNMLMSTSAYINNTLRYFLVTKLVTNLPTTKTTPDPGHFDTPKAQQPCVSSFIRN